MGEQQGDLRGTRIATDRTFVSILVLAAVSLNLLTDVPRLRLDEIYIAGVAARQKKNRYL